MKIATNSFGNYNPVINKTHNISRPVIETKTENAVKISKEEKQFFSNLYPNDKEQVENYHYYNKEGDKNGVSLGSLFDKRG